MFWFSPRLCTMALQSCFKNKIGQTDEEKLLCIFEIQESLNEKKYNEVAFMPLESEGYERGI